MRDVLGKSQAQWKREQNRVAKEGWGERLLSLRDAGGTWGGGIYTPKWTSATCTLLVLRDMGLPRVVPTGAAGARLIVDKELGAITDKDFGQRLANLDLCIAGSRPWHRCAMKGAL